MPPLTWLSPRTPLRSPRTPPRRDRGRRRGASRPTHRRLLLAPAPSSPARMHCPRPQRSHGICWPYAPGAACARWRMPHSAWALFPRMSCWSSPAVQRGDACAVAKVPGSSPSPRSSSWLPRAWPILGRSGSAQVRDVLGAPAAAAAPAASRVAPQCWPRSGAPARRLAPAGRDGCGRHAYGRPSWVY